MRAAAREAGSGRRAAVRGVSEQVVSVRVPVPGVFREAVFFLHEDYLRRGDLGREELLRQARAAAEDYLRPYVPAHRRAAWWPYPLLVLLGSALGLGLAVLLGIG